MRTGPYSDRVRAKLERMRGVRRPAAEKQKELADLTSAWRSAQRGHGWEDIRATYGVPEEAARRLVGFKKRASA